MPPKAKKQTTKKGKRPQTAPSMTKMTNSLLKQTVPKVASLAGMLATRAIGKIVGVGDYTVSSNSIETTGGTIGGEVPHFGKENNSTRIRHREFISDVTVPATPTAFTNTTYVINPSNTALFPWLSRLAESYQQYRVHGMVFYFKSTTSDYAANGALGKVAMATNYNVRDSAYANMQELENAEFSVSGKPSLSRMHPIECAANNGLPLVRYVRDAQYDASGGDDRLYDIGKFQFATQGLAGSANQVIGELWVTYDIEFFKPIVGRNAAAQQYVPVTVPVFDTLGGDGSTSLFQVEKTTKTIPDGSTLAQIWDYLHKPDTFVRAAPVVVDSAKVSFSANRPTPDINPSQYPSYWATGVYESDSGDPGGVTLQSVPTKRELRITRPGVWYMTFKLRQQQESNLGNNYAITQGPPAAANLTQWMTGSVSYRVCDSDGRSNSDYTVAATSSAKLVTTCNMAVSSNSLGDQVQSIAARPPAIPTYQTVQVFNYADGGSWTAVFYVDPSVVAAGRAFCVRFQTPNEATTNALNPNKLPFEWQTYGQVVNPATLKSLIFELGFVNVSNQTFYTPAVSKALTGDDKETIQRSVGSIQALMPKLKELGII